MHVISSAFYDFRVATIQFLISTRHLTNVEQNEIDDKDVEFVKFEILFSSKICEFDAMFYVTALKTIEIIS